MLYACKECGAEARVEGDVVLRSCVHTGTVVANIKAHARGLGSTAQKSLRQRFVGHLKTIARNLGVGR